MTVTNNTGWEPRTASTNITLSILMVLIIVIAVLGNIFVILAVFLSYHLRSSISNLLLVNLSVTDITSATVVMISSVVAISADRWELGNAWCFMVCGANYCLIIVSMLTLCLISLDRYLAIVHSLRYQDFITKPRVLILIAYTWLQGVAFGVPPIICDWVDYDYWEATCSIQWHHHGYGVVIYVIVAFILCFFVPGVVLVVAYCSILDAVKKLKPRPRPTFQTVTSDFKSGSRSSYKSEQQLQQRRLKYREGSRAIGSLLIVVLAFFICMTPFSLTKLYRVSVTKAHELPGYTNMLATFFQYLSSVVNPLIYGLLRKDFQKALLHMQQKARHISLRRKVKPTHLELKVTVTQF